VAVQKAAKEEINWILETKGRIWEGTEAKEEAIKQWCERITEQTGKLWKFFRINQVGFESKEPKTLMEIVKGSEPREGKLV
jgi:type III restriction enzyme